MEHLQLTHEQVYSDDQHIIADLPELSSVPCVIAALNEDDIIRAKESALEETIMFLLQDVETNSDIFIESFPREKFYTVSTEHNHMLSQFLADLSWYVPTQKRQYIHELKRTLSLIAI